MNRTTATFLLASLLASASALAVEKKPEQGSTGLPSDSNVINVRSFGAVGDGTTDDTEAILKAIAASGVNTGPSPWQDNIVYFPDGTYLISAPLLKRYNSGGYEGKFACGMTLVGQSEAHTILRLKDHAPGYDAPAHPRAMIFPTSKLYDRSGPYGGGKNYPDLGEGNDAYRNSVETMTVDAGHENPGAIAIDYLASNVGRIHAVTVTAPAGSGLTGIAMTRKFIGPALLDHVTVKGFETGIDVGNFIYGITFNHIVIDGAKTGLRNNRNEVSSNDLVIRAIGPAIENLSSEGQIVLAQAKLTSRGPVTVKNDAGTIVFHDSRATHSKAFAAAVPEGGPLDGYLTGPTGWTPLRPGDFVPVVDAPRAPAAPLAKWANVVAHGAKPLPHYDVKGEPDGTPEDSYAAFNAAFATGASTVYLPHGVYYVSRNLVIPDSVERIVGLNSTIRVYKQDGYKVTRDEGLIRVVSPSKKAAPLRIEGLNLSNANGGPQLGIEYDAPRTLVIEESFFSGAVMLTRGERGGEVFLSDTNSGGRSSIKGKAPFHAVQFDVEGCDICLTSTGGANIDILGLKTEADVTAVDATGGHTQVLGGLLYVVRQHPDPKKPAFRMRGATLTASFIENSPQPDTSYTYYVEEIANGKTSLTPQSDFPRRSPGNEGRNVPWLQVPGVAAGKP